MENTFKQKLFKNFIPIVLIFSLAAGTTGCKEPTPAEQRAAEREKQLKNIEKEKAFFLKQIKEDGSWDSSRDPYEKLRTLPIDKAIKTAMITVIKTGDWRYRDDAAEVLAWALEKALEEKRSSMDDIDILEIDNSKSMYKELRTLMVSWAQNKDDHYEYVRRVAIKALAKLPIDAEIKTLMIDRAQNDTDGDTRRAAIAPLIRLPMDEEIKAVLIDRAQNDTDGDVRNVAIKALAKLPMDEDIQILMTDRAENDDRGYLRERALNALAPLLPNTEIKTLMMDRAKSDDSGDLRKKILKILEELPMDKDIQALMMDRAENDNTSIRLFAMKTLEKAPMNEDIKGFMVDRAKDAKEGQERKIALNTLAKESATDDNVKFFLIDRVQKAEESDERETAVKALADTVANDDRVKTFMTGTVRGEDDWNVRKAAMELLLANKFIKETTKALYQNVRVAPKNSDSVSYSIFSLKNIAKDHTDKPGILMDAVEKLIPLSVYAHDDKAEWLKERDYYSHMNSNAMSGLMDIISAMPTSST